MMTETGGEGGEMRDDKVCVKYVAPLFCREEELQLLHQGCDNL